MNSSTEIKGKEHVLDLKWSIANMIKIPIDVDQVMQWIITSTFIVGNQIYNLF